MGHAKVVMFNGEFGLYSVVSLTVRRTAFALRVPLPSWLRHTALALCVPLPSWLTHTALPCCPKVSQSRGGSVVVTGVGAVQAAQLPLYDPAFH